jgi:hypothetical protein
MEPSYFDLLSDSDRQQYVALRGRFAEDARKSRRAERFDTFRERLNSVRDFVERNDDDSWKRSLVCGLFFLRNSLAVNIQQVRILFGKCKSLINGSLQQLGYSAERATPEEYEELILRLPGQVADAFELKKWSMRRQAAEQARPFIVPVPMPWRVDVETEAVDAVVRRVPCPIKCRYKYLDIIQRSVSIQTEA